LRRGMRPWPKTPKYMAMLQEAVTGADMHAAEEAAKKAKEKAERRAAEAAGKDKGGAKAKH
jgi:hypothetical protein